jgi:hypothetical protein
MKTNGIRRCSWKNGWIFSLGTYILWYSMYVVLQGIGSFPCIRVYNTGYTIARLHLATSLALSAFHNFEEAQQGYLHSYTVHLNWAVENNHLLCIKTMCSVKKKHFAVNTFWFSVMFKDMRCKFLSNLQFWGVSLHQTYTKFTYQECNFDVNLHAQV